MRYIKAFARRFIALNKLFLIKVMNNKNFKFKFIQLISISTKFSLKNRGIINLDSNIGTRKNVEFRTDGGQIIIGKNCFFNNNCMVVSHEKIIIGDNCRFGPGVMFFDHDYDYKSKSINNMKKYKTSSIEIGNNVWIGANTIILRGSKIGNNCVIGAGSVIKGTYESGTTIIQKREEIIQKYNLL